MSQVKFKLPIVGVGKFIAELVLFSKHGIDKTEAHTLLVDLVSLLGLVLSDNEVAIEAVSPALKVVTPIVVEALPIVESIIP